MTSHLGDMLRNWRLQRKLSLGAFSLKSGVHKSTLSRWEAGQSQPRLSELEQVLAALEAGSLWRRQALAALEAPRAVARLRTEDNLKQTAPPTGGDLLRAMRLRQGLTLTEIAQRIGVASSILSRWERGEQWPDAARLHALCFALKASPAEVTALTCGGLWLSDPLESEEEEPAAPEIWEARLRQAWWSGDETRDLKFLTLEARLWRLAARQENGLSLLECAYAFHARALMDTGRLKEAVPYAERSLELMRRGHYLDAEWAQSALALAAGMAQNRHHPDPTGAARFLAKWLPQVENLSLHAWMLGEIGCYLAQSGQTEGALAAEREACRVAARSPDPHELLFRQRDQARSLILIGCYGSALDMLEVAAPLMQKAEDARAHHLLLQSEGLMGAGKPTAAEENYAQATHLIATHQYRYLDSRAEAVGQRLAHYPPAATFHSLS